MNTLNLQTDIRDCMSNHCITTVNFENQSKIKKRKITPFKEAGVNLLRNVMQMLPY